MGNILKLVSTGISLFMVYKFFKYDVAIKDDVLQIKEFLRASQEDSWNGSGY